MTDPAGGPPGPTPPPQQSNWQAPAQPQAAAGPAPGVAYADVVIRIISLIIDGIILGIIYAIISLVLTPIGNLPALIVGGLLYLAISAGYFVYTWTRMRGSPGNKVLNLETVNATDGATLTQDQAIRRWAFLWGPSAIAQIVSYGPGLALGFLGLFLSLLALIYEIYLLYTVTQSPKRQGFHDVQAGSVVVKRLG